MTVAPPPLPSSLRDLANVTKTFTVIIGSISKSLCIWLIQSWCSTAYSPEFLGPSFIFTTNLLSFLQQGGLKKASKLESFHSKVRQQIFYRNTNALVKIFIIIKSSKAECVKLNAVSSTTIFAVECRRLFVGGHRPKTKELLELLLFFLFLFLFSIWYISSLKGILGEKPSPAGI